MERSHSIAAHTTHTHYLIYDLGFVENIKISPYKELQVREFEWVNRVTST